MVASPLAATKMARFLEAPVAGYTQEPSQGLVVLAHAGAEAGMTAVAQPSTGSP